MFVVGAGFTRPSFLLVALGNCGATSNWEQEPEHRNPMREVLTFDRRQLLQDEEQRVIPQPAMAL